MIAPRTLCRTSYRTALPAVRAISHVRAAARGLNVLG